MVEAVMEADGVVSRVVMLDFLRALRRARRASSGLEEGGDGICKDAPRFAWWFLMETVFFLEGK